MKTDTHPQGPPAAHFRSRFPVKAVIHIRLHVLENYPGSSTTVPNCRLLRVVRRLFLASFDDRHDRYLPRRDPQFGTQFTRIVHIIVGARRTWQNHARDGIAPDRLDGEYGSHCRVESNTDSEDVSFTPGLLQLVAEKLGHAVDSPFEVHVNYYETSQMPASIRYLGETGSLYRVPKALRCLIRPKQVAL